MPVIQSQGCPINVETEGAANAPVLMLCNSLGTDLHMWDAQAGAFAKDFRLVRYDRRGHGKSGVPKGPYTMEMLGRDALAVMDALGLKKVNWCGLSMGGMVGPTMERWFTKEFRERAPDRIAVMRDMFLKTQLDGFLGCCHSVRNMDLRDTHARITAPTLVIVGSRDPATPPAAGEAIQKAIKGARLASLDAAHISNFEQPQV